MARRSTVDRGPQPAVYVDGPGPAADPPDQREPGSARTWRGAGGRWMVWTLRVVVWVVLLIIGYRGISAIVLNETPATRGGSAAKATSPQSQFPAGLAEAYAMQFGQVYLNVSQANASQRARQLASFVPAGLGQQFGWNGVGQLQLQSEQVAGIDVRDARHAVVTLLAQVNGHLMELGVPVYAADGGMAVSGEPAWLAAPPNVALPPGPPASSDPVAVAALTSQLPGFFQAYASGNANQLGRFLAPGASVTGLGGAVTYGSIPSLFVPPGGTTRQIVATVSWQLPGAAGAAAGALEMTYEMTGIQQSGKWYIKDIRASTQAMGSS